MFFRCCFDGSRETLAAERLRRGETGPLERSGVVGAEDIGQADIDEILLVL